MPTCSRSRTVPRIMWRLLLVACLLAASTMARSDGISGFGFSTGGFGDGVSSNGLTLTLSNSTIVSTATVGTTIGTLAVIGGTGSYTFTFTSNPGTLFAISGSNLNVAAALTAGSDPITIQANNGAGSIITQPFTITVTGPCSGSMNFSQACNSQYLF